MTIRAQTGPPCGGPCSPEGCRSDFCRVDREEERDERLLAYLATKGASRCCYMPGAGNPEAWRTARCDCKYIGPLGRPLGMSEQTGCCEMLPLLRRGWVTERRAVPQLASGHLHPLVITPAGLRALADYLFPGHGMGFKAR